MNRRWLPRLSAPGGGEGFDVDLFRAADDELVEGFLVSKHTRDTYPLIAGVPALPPRLREHLRAYGSVYRRTPLRDPRMVRFVVGQAGRGYDAVPFDLVIAHYRDLADDPPPDFDVTPHPEDTALERLLVALLPTEPLARAVVVGCGVGRSAFVLGSHAAHTLGVDFSLALVRRARNIAVTSEDFFLPGPRVDGKRGPEVRLDLDGLVRDGVDFAVGCGTALPLMDHAGDVVLVHAADSRGAWQDPAAVVREARRVLRPGGWLVWDAGLPDAVAADAREGDFAGARLR